MIALSKLSRLGLAPKVICAILVGSILLLGPRLYRVALDFASESFVFHRQGDIVDVKALAKPLYPSSDLVPLYDVAEEHVVGVLQGMVVFPQRRDDRWVVGEVYFWAKIAEISQSVGEAKVIAKQLDMRSKAGIGQDMGSLNRGARLQALYINEDETWALCKATGAVQANQLRDGEQDILSKFFNTSFPVVTLTKEAGDAHGQVTRNQIGETGLGLLLILPTLAAVWILRPTRRRVVSRNTIRISGIQSSSINVQSPLGSAITQIGARGDAKVARALVELSDLVDGLVVEADQRRSLKELIVGLASEGSKDSPSIPVLKAIGKELSIAIAGSIIADQAVPLVEEISQLWHR